MKDERCILYIIKDKALTAVFAVLLIGVILRDVIGVTSGRLIHHNILEARVIAVYFQRRLSTSSPVRLENLHKLYSIHHPVIYGM